MDGSLQDLNDLHFFAAVVRHGGFSAAGRALGIAKSRLSKRIARLEERLGVRLLQRTTRRFVVTEVGKRFYQHCQAMLEEARAAEEAVAALRSEPRGIVRVSCPVSLAQSLLAPLLPEFLRVHPKVQLKLLANNRRVDVIGEGYDVAIRVRERLDDGDASLILRSFARIRNRLVASPAFLARAGGLEHPSQLAAHATLSMFEHEGEQRWSLLHKDGSVAAVELRPHLLTGDFTVLLEAAIQGIGIALLPESVCAAAVGAGRLQVVLEDWEAKQGILHLVYPSRRGMLPAVRSFVDFLAERLPGSQQALPSQD